MDVVRGRMVRVFIALVGFIYALISVTLVGGGAKLIMMDTSHDEGGAKLVGLIFGTITLIPGIVAGLIAWGCRSLYWKVKHTLHLDEGGVLLLGSAVALLVCAFAFGWKRFVYL